MSTFYEELEKRFQDAKSRLVEVQARLQKVQVESLGAQQEVNSLNLLMQKERERGTHEPLKLLPDFICEKLATRNWKKTEILEEAIKRGYFADQKGSPGRIFHLTFVNLLKTGRVKHLGNENYGATKTVQPNLPVIHQHGGSA